MASGTQCTCVGVSLDPLGVCHSDSGEKPNVN